MDFSVIKNNLLSTFKNISDKRKTLLVVAFGILLMIAICFSGSDSKSELPKEESKQQSESDTELADRLEDFLKKIEGAGRVEVMLTFETDEEKVFAKDSEEKENITQDGKNEINLKNEHIIIEKESGEGGLEITKIYPKIRGVAIICDGGNNAVVKSKIVSAVSALFDINTNKISVSSMAA